MESATDDITTSLRVASFACYLDTTKESLVHRVPAQEAPIILNSGKAKTPITRPPLDANTAAFLKANKEGTFRVDSFSYRNAGGENFMFNIPKPIQDPSNTFTFSKELPKDGEINIFGADKYFNAIKPYHREEMRCNPMQPAPTNLTRIGSDPQIRPPSTLRSETSSCNSHALIPNIPRNESSNPKKSTHSRRSCWFPSFVCKGPCFNKKDILINKFVTENESNGTLPDQKMTENPMSAKNMELLNFEDSRNSIEVFGSGIALKGDVAANMERKLSMLTWDAIPKGKLQNLSPPATVRSSTICDDMASDASSDLFEIENISGSMYPVAAAAATAAADGGVSGCTSPVSCYAPSEASIQWSVVTASAADYSSAVSDCCNDDGISREKIGPKSGAGPDTKARARAGGLLGCTSQKAVDVVNEKTITRV